MGSTGWVWVHFTLCLALIGGAGYELARSGDLIARRTGLSASWIGLGLLATITSLPELSSGISAVTAAAAPNIAVGDALGSCVINLAFLVVVDLLHRPETLYRRASASHVLSAGFGVILLGFVAFGLVVGKVAPPQGGPSGVQGLQTVLGLSTPVLLAMYLVALRSVFQHERRQQAATPGTRDPEATPATTTGRLALRFSMAALVVVSAGSMLPLLAVDLAEAMQWNRSFVGTLFVALATSVPELAVTVSALRVGSLDLAVGNLLGSNLFNVAILAVDDFFYAGGPLLAEVSLAHAMTATTAVVMTGIAAVGLSYRPDNRVMRTVDAVSLCLLAMVVLNGFALFVHGE